MQAIARDKLANMDNVDVEKIIENPLTKEQIIEVIKIVNDRYDAYQGITYETFMCALDEITLPCSEYVRKKSELELQVEEVENLLSFYYTHESTISKGDVSKIELVIQRLKENQKE